MIVRIAELAATTLDFQKKRMISFSHIIYDNSDD